MASISSGTTLSKHSKRMQTTKTKHNNLQNPSLLLKDYLVRDDLSSCSSNGFKSFPRRQCCTTVGLIFVEKKDLKLQQRKRRRSQPPRSVSSSSSCSPSSKVSVLQRASKAVINAIKSLPLNSYDKKTVAAGVLSRSFSRKLLSRSFWRKPAANEDELGGKGTQRWRTSFRELLMLERDKTTSFNEDSVVCVFAAPSSSTTSSSRCGSNNSWGGSEFTFSSSSAASSSESSAENDVAEGTKEVAQLGKTVEEATRDWETNEEKEQFSPVSVLDCAFGDDDEVITPHFNSTTHPLLEGAKHKHMQKRGHFKNVASVEPLALEKRKALSEIMEDEQHNNSTKHCSTLVPIKCTQNGNTNMLHCNIEENAARDLLNFVKRSIPSFNSLIIEAENLLFDYFKQSFMENNEINHNQSEIFHLCKVVEDWINGESRELYLGWEVQEGRRDYIKEMDKCAEWRNNDREVQQLALEVENEVFSSLVDEIILD